jgi:Leucine-rich repeat (LRR) protein
VAAAANIPHLESLSLRKDKPASSHSKPTNWTTASLAPLSQAEELRELHVHGQGFTDEHLQNLARLPALKSLLISDTSITDAGLRAVLQAAPNLEKLVVDQSPIIGSGLSNLKQCPRLFELSIGKCPLTDDDFATIREAQQLKRLQLWECDALTDKALEHVGALADLQSLRATGGQFTDAGVRHLANLQSLTLLTLRSKSGAFSDASAFAALHGLMYLDTGRPLPTVEFDKLQRAMPNLKISPPPSP